jgi:presenilin-like A22 family membrane protease
MILLYVHSEWYVVNTVGVLVGAGVVVMLGVAFVPTLIIVFMIAAAIYDAWAVYKSKHMLDLADTMIGLRLPILLVAPQEKGYSFVEETTSMKQTSEPVARPQGAPKKKSKDAMFMGLGDVIFPGMLVVSAAQWLDHSDALLVALSTLIGGLVGYFILMTYVARGRAQAGLPLLNGGSILGYVVGGFFFIGSTIFDFGISF